MLAKELNLIQIGDGGQVTIVNLDNKVIYSKAFEELGSTSGISQSKDQMEKGNGSFMSPDSKN